MSSVNKVLLIGRLGRDPEVRYSPAGEAIVNLALATSDKWTDKTTGTQKEQTEWHRIVLYRRTAEVAAEFLKKGSMAYIEGKLQTRKWDDKDGITRYTTEIVGHNLQMLGARPESQAAPADSRSYRDAKEGRIPPPQNDPFNDDEIPF